MTESVLLSGCKGCLRAVFIAFTAFFVFIGDVFEKLSVLIGNYGGKSLSFSVIEFITANGRKSRCCLRSPYGGRKDPSADLLVTKKRYAYLVE